MIAKNMLKNTYLNHKIDLKIIFLKKLNKKTLYRVRQNTTIMSHKYLQQFKTKFTSILW